MFSKPNVLFCVFVILGSKFEELCVEDPLTADVESSDGYKSVKWRDCRFFSTSPNSLITLPLCISEGNPFNIKDHELADMGLRSQKEKKYEEAINYFTKASIQNPTYPRHYRLRGNCFMEMERWDEAVSDFREVLKISRNDKTDRLALCRALFESRNYEEAVKETIEVDDVEEIVKLADKLTARGVYNEAIRCYTLAIVRNSSEAKYYRLRGICFARMKNFSSAISDFRSAALKDPSDGENRSLLRRAIADYGKIDGAVEEILPSLNDTELEALGSKFSYDKKCDEAVRCYTLAIEKNPFQSEYYRMRGKCFLTLKKFDMAAFDFCKIVRTDPFNEQNDTLLNRALSDVVTVTPAANGMLKILDETKLETLAGRLYSKRQFLESIKCYTEAIRRNPREAQFYRQRGRCYLKMGNVDMAMNDYRTMIGIDPDDQSNRTYLKNTLLDAGIFNQVSEETLAVLSDDELAAMGNEYFPEGRVKEAIRCYSVALQKSPFDVRNYKRRAYCYWDLEVYEQAVSDFRSIVQLDSDDTKNRETLIRALFDCEKFDDAIDEVLVLDDVNELVAMGEKLTAKKEYNAAIRCYDLAIKRNPFNETNYYRLRGQCYASMASFYTAVVNFHHAVEIEPLDEQNRTLLIDALYNCGTVNADLEETIGLLNDTELARLGEKFLSNNGYDLALIYYSKALKKNSKQALYHHRRSLCYRSMNSLDEALRDRRKAVEMRPSNVRYRVDLVEILSEAGKYEEAAAVLNVEMNDPLLDAARSQLEAVMTKQRLAKLIPYATELIIRDTERRMAKAKVEMTTNNEELQTRIKELEIARDDYLEKLTNAYREFNTLKTYERKLSTSQSRSFSHTEIPSYFMDKVSLELIDDPVIVPSGITYDKSTLKQCLKDKKMDPMTRGKLYENQLIPNKAIKEAIESWRRKN